MSLLQSVASPFEDDVKADSLEVPSTFPPTCTVIQFSPTASPEAINWFVQRIHGDRNEGGAELLVRRQPFTEKEGTFIHVSASRIKLLELAEEYEIKKRDNAGLVREFVASDLDSFIHGDTTFDTVLTWAEKNRLVHQQIESLRAQASDVHVPGYPNVKLFQGQSLVQVLTHENILTHMFALHNQEDLERLGKKWYWAFLQRQPFEEIRLYFGEAIALYFSFLGFYTTALLVPCIVGIIQVFLGSETIVYFCIFNLFWVTLFLEAWKRKCNELTFAWGTLGLRSPDVPRANYIGKMGIDPVTGRYQPQYPMWKTNVKLYCVSLPVVFLCLLGAFWIMLCAFWAEEALVHWKRHHGSTVAGVFTFLPSVTYAASIFIMNKYYRLLATYLTEWENYRTQAEYDRHRVTKLVLFEFANNFMSLFYIAFYIQDMDMLRQQLAVLLIILQAINNFQEALLPIVIKRYASKIYDIASVRLEEFKKSRRKQNRAFEAEPPPPPPLKKFDSSMLDIPELDPTDPRIEQTRQELTMEAYEGTYDDYLELFVQFGYVFLFSAAYPMAAFWAVVNNVLEIRADAFKLCCHYQRPHSRRVKDIGAWQGAFEAIGAVAVVTNCGLLALSPEMRKLAPRLSNVEWLLLFVGLEHLILAAKLALGEIIPDLPESVQIALAKINYLSSQSLKNERRIKTRRQLTRRFKTVHRTHGQADGHAGNKLKEL